MRKTLLLTMFLIVVLLSGCASESDDEPTGESSRFDSYLSYDFDTFTYTNTDESDILYGIGSASTDYIIMTNREQELTTSEEEAYKSLFTGLDEVNAADQTFSYDQITTYSSRDIEDYAGKSNLDITITDIITFNAMKSDLEDYESDYPTRISKQDYIEVRIDRELTPDELQGFYLLQEYYFELIYYNEVTYSFEANTFDELLILFNDNTGYTPLEDDKPKLESAYNILHLILIE